MGLKNTFPFGPGNPYLSFTGSSRRMLGLVRMDGEVFSTDKIMRTVFFRIKFPVFLNVYTTFIRSRIEYDLPALICEVVFVGKKIILVLDVHRTGEIAELEQDKPLFDKLSEIKSRYDDLLAFEMEARGSLAEIVASRAMCRLKIGADQENRAVELIKEYIDAFGEYVVGSQKLSGEALAVPKKILIHTLKRLWSMTRE